MAEEKSESSFAQAVDHSTEPSDGENSSGMHGSVPPEIMGGWNWGAFLLTWIWGIGHSVWIALLAFIVPWPIMAIILGVKGNEWAWQNRRFESVEHFRKVQRKWAIWGVIIVVAGFVIGAIIMAIIVIAAMGEAQDEAREEYQKSQKVNNQINDYQSDYYDNFNKLFNNTSDTATNEL